MIKRICIIGCGSIGSLYAAHLSRVVEVYALVRREEHARALNQQGLHVSGRPDPFTASIKATANPKELPAFDLGIITTKATQTRQAIAPVARLFDEGMVISAENGIGCEEIIAEHTQGYVIRGTTFMSGTRHSDTHVQLELDEATWLGPFEPTHTPFSMAQEAANLIVAAGLKAEALEDVRPAQWSKLIFNASVNAVGALTNLTHCPQFANESAFPSLGRLLHDLIREGEKVAKALGIQLYKDPWKMNKLGAQTYHPPSMLYDVRNHLQTEIDFLCGAIAREAERAGISAPLHTALYRLVKGKEASWEERPKEGNEH